MVREHVYSNNFLSQVIIRADFDAPHESIRDQLPPDFRKAFATGFPRVEERDGHTQEVTLRVHERSHEVSQRVSDSFKMWRLLSPGGGVLEVCKDYVSHNVSSYHSFERFAAPFFEALDRMAKAEGSGLSYRRLGLRYIDEIAPGGDGDPLDWSGMIVKKLTGALEFVKDDRLARAMGVIETDLDVCRVRMQYGLPNPDYPAPVNRRLFVLDTDAYISALVTHAEIREKAAELCRVCNLYFERAIGVKLRALMGPVVEP